MTPELEIGLYAAKELHDRKIDALSLFRPLEKQEPFFLSESREILNRGGNRSGKSTVCAIRFAAIARNKPIKFADGSSHDLRLRWQKDRPLVMWVVGYNGDHIGATIYRLLFRSGVFKIIRDLKTGEWRAFNPETDADREHEAKPSPPLIPMSEVEDITWENKGEKYFKVVTLKNCTLIYAWSSMGEVKQGDMVDEIWIDEAIKHPNYYAEYQARTADTKGRVVWSSWPKRGNVALRTLTKRARDARKEGKTDWVQEFVFTFSGNPHIASTERERVRAGWGEEDKIARDLGEYAVDSLKMYPHFSPDIHCAYGDDPQADDELASVLRANKGQPPADWTRALVLDPGTNYPGIVLFAIPPRNFGDYLVPYDELYPGRKNAEELAKLVRDKTFGQFFEWFIGDTHALAPKSMGSSVTNHQVYAKAFRDEELSCRTTGSSFLFGEVDVEARIGMVHRLMTIQSNGRPMLRIVTASCPKLCEQLESYEKKIHELTGDILEKPADHQHIDLAQTLEYMAAFSWHYVEPPLPRHPSRMSRAAANYIKKKQQDRGGRVVHCGPEAALQGA